MLESSSLSLEEFTLASRTLKRRSGKRRHVSEAFATVSWFHELRLRLGTNSVYGIAAAMGPEDAPKATRVRLESARYRAYRFGRCSPPEDRVRSVNGIYAGSETVFRLPLWRALDLDLDPTNSEAVLAVLGSVGPEVHKIGWRCLTAGRGWVDTDDHWDVANIARIERIANIDALAIALVALRWASTNRHHQTAYRLSRVVCRMLLTSGPWLYTHGIARPFVDYVSQTALAAGEAQGHRHGFRHSGYIDTLRHLMASVQAQRPVRSVSGEEWMQLLSAEFSREVNNLVISEGCATAG